jgi:transcriptional regulator with XRE-family HTH domain
MSDTKTRLTNQEVAERLGLSHSTVSRIRRADRLTSVDVLQRISVEFDVPAEELMSAAASAHRGDKYPWIRLMERTFGGPST